MADGEVRSEDAFAWALRALRASAMEPTFELAEQAVTAMISRRSPAEIREIAAALALVPKWATRSLRDVAEIDRLALEFAWVFSDG